MNERKIVRVEIEYEDGEMERAVGNDAAEIWKAVSGAFAFKQIHGMPYSGPKMKVVSKES